MMNNHTIKKHPRAPDTYIYYAGGMCGVGINGVELKQLYFEIKQLLMDNDLLSDKYEYLKTYEMGFVEGMRVARLEDRLSASDIFEISDVLPPECCVCGSCENLNRYYNGEKTVYFCENCKKTHLNNSDI